MDSYKGLNEVQLKENIKKYGLNIIKEEKKKTLISIIFSQLKDSTIYLLIIAGTLSLLLKEYVDSIIIFLVLILNTIIGTIQEYKAEKSLEALKKLQMPMCNVIRNGKLQVVEVEKITIDDLVYLKEGDIVPADLVLLKSSSLTIDESLLTGESLPLEKDENYIEKENEGIGDKKNHCYKSTTVVSGNGIGRVISIGMNTEIGKIADMLNEEEEETPLQIKLDKVSKFLGIFTIVLAILIFIIGIILNFNYLEILIFSISLGVAAIPEGLPAVVTIVLSLGVKKMVKEKAIVRKLPSVETLGSVEVVCSDKTGTITKNELEVRELFSFSKDNDLLFSSFYYCNNVSENIGDALEISLLNYLKNKGLFSEKQGKRIKEYPFSSQRKMMSVLINENNEELLFSKGAYEVLINKCNYFYKDGNILSLDKETINKIDKEALKMENKAYRVLSFAYKNKDKEEDMIFLGLVGFIDPPRDNIASTISLMNNAGIKVLMITGDHKITAYNIAKEVGIVSSLDECVSGDELDYLIENNLSLDKYRVFSRVNPSHKVKIVDYYKNKNKVVAMTGDGVNDSPALKKADVGIAMGNGSEVAKNSGDIILVDNNFKTLEKAIEEGRNIFLNIKKSVLFLLSSNLGEVLSVVIFLLLRLPLPLLSIHILWVNLISDSLPALALGSDKKYKDVMNDPPRNKDESLFSKNGLFLILFYGILIFVITSISYLIIPINRLINLDVKINISNINLILQNEEVLNKSRTFAFTTLGISQLFHMIGMSNIKENIFNILKNKNIFRVVAFVIGFFLQILVTEIPFFIKIFKTTRLSILEWGWLILISTTPLIFQQIIKKGYKTGL